MRILFIHGNYPAQFRQLASSLGASGLHEVRFLTARQDAARHPIAGVAIETMPELEAAPQLGHPALAATQESLRRGYNVINQLSRLATEGFVPELVIFHGGNGLGLHIRELLPECRLIGYYEWYFNTANAQPLLGSNDLSTRLHIRLRNLTMPSELLSCDAAVVPTEWQARQFPPALQPLLSLQFDGIDTSYFSPPAAPLGGPQSFHGEAANLTVDDDTLLLSYATRGMEPLRGFPDFLRCLPPLLARFPQLQVLIGGRDRSAYGRPAPSHQGSWKEAVLAELGDFPGRERIHFPGLMPYGSYRLLLRRSDLHVYLTRPYVTSWSFFEAAACGTPLLVNRGEATTGTLPAAADHVVELDQPGSLLAGLVVALEQAARLRRERHWPPRVSRLPASYALPACLQGWQELINRTAPSARLAQHAPSR